MKNGKKIVSVMFFVFVLNIVVVGVLSASNRNQRGGRGQYRLSTRRSAETLGLLDEDPEDMPPSVQRALGITPKEDKIKIIIFAIAVAFAIGCFVFAILYKLDEIKKAASQESANTNPNNQTTGNEEEGEFLENPTIIKEEKEEE